MFHVLYLIPSLPWGPLDDSFLRGHRLDNVVLYLLGISDRVLPREELVDPPNPDCGEAAYGGCCEGSKGSSGLGALTVHLCPSTAPN